MVADEIIGRYYSQKGRIEYMLKDDKGLIKAQSVLANAEEYRKILKL